MLIRHKAPIFAVGSPDAHRIVCCSSNAFPPSVISPPVDKPELVDLRRAMVVAVEFIGRNVAPLKTRMVSHGARRDGRLPWRGRRIGTAKVVLLRVQGEGTRDGVLVDAWT